MSFLGKILGWFKKRKPVPIKIIRAESIGLSGGVVLKTLTAPYQMYYVEDIVLEKEYGEQIIEDVVMETIKYDLLNTELSEKVTSENSEYVGLESNNG